MLAVQNEFSEATVLALIELGSDVQVSDLDGMTCLHHAYWCENDSIFKLLLNKGANPDQADNEGDTARSLAQDNIKFSSALV